MNFGELKAAAQADTHRTYDAATMLRFTAQGEALIRATLKSYGLTVALTDADRSGPTSGVYTLPSRTSRVRFVFNAAGAPLDQVDENQVWSSRAASSVTMYVVRPAAISVAGVPGAGTTLALHYMGVPAALVADGDTNQLLTDYPQLYLDALAVYMHERAQDYESAERCAGRTRGLIRDINRNVANQLGGARAVPVYNVSHRSSY